MISKKILEICNDGFLTPEEMKIRLGLDPETDNRTLNKYVVQGKLDIKPLSNKVKLYRLSCHDNSNKGNDICDDDWVCAS